MPTTRTFPGTPGGSILDFNEFNGSGATLTQFCEYINAYLSIAAGVAFGDLGSVGIGVPAGDGASNFGPLYNFTYVPQNLPVTFRFKWGDQDWSQAPLDPFSKIPIGSTINSIRFDGTVNPVGDISGATDWALVISADGITITEITPDFFGTPLSPTTDGPNSFATVIATNPVTGLPWTRSEIFSYEFGIKIKSGTAPGTVAVGVNPYYSGGGPNPNYYGWFEIGASLSLLVDYTEGNIIDGDLSVELTLDGGLFAIESDLSIEATLAADFIISVNASGLYTLIPNLRHDVIYVDSGNGGDTIDVPIPKPFIKTAYIND